LFLQPITTQIFTPLKLYVTKNNFLTATLSLEEHLWSSLNISEHLWNILTISNEQHKNFKSKWLKLIHRCRVQKGSMFQRRIFWNYQWTRRQSKDTIISKLNSI
jgi:hypothetical protein